MTKLRLIPLLIIAACLAAAAPKKAPDEPTPLKLLEDRVQTLEQAQEAQTTQLTRDDLAAQESMANSTTTIARLTAWQLIAAIIGTGAVVYTLVSTRKNLEQSATQLKHAEDQLALTQTQGRQQMRAYISIEDFKATPGGKAGSYTIEANVRNRGLTPASNVQWCVFHAFVDRGGDDQPWDIDPDRAAGPRGLWVAPGAMVKPSHTVTYKAADLARVYAGTAGIWATAEVVYTDIFGTTYRRRASLTFTGGGLARMSPTIQNNDEVELSKAE